MSSPKSPTTRGAGTPGAVTSPQQLRLSPKMREQYQILISLKEQRSPVSGGKLKSNADNESGNVRSPFQFNDYTNSFGQPNLNFDSTKFFASSLQSWYPIFEDVTFATESIELQPRALVEALMVDVKYQDLITSEEDPSLLNNNNNESERVIVLPTNKVIIATSPEYVSPFSPNHTIQNGPKSPTHDSDQLKKLGQRIDRIMRKRGWRKVFVKLSARSPKDSGVIFEKARDRYQAEIKRVEQVRNGAISTLQEDEVNQKSDSNLNISRMLLTHEEKLQLRNKVSSAEQLLNNPQNRTNLLFQLVQDFYPVESGSEAIHFLKTSQRIREDLAEYLRVLDATEFKMENSYCIGTRNSIPTLCLEIREYKEAIPIDKEFRCILWEGEVHVIWQYYHSLYFEKLAVEEEIRKGTELENANNLSGVKLQNKIKHDLYRMLTTPVQIKLNVTSEGANTVTQTDSVLESHKQHHLQQQQQYESQTLSLPASRIDHLKSIGLQTCVIDFAYKTNNENPNDSNRSITVIEVNPFDPKNGLGTSRGSMGTLIDWDNEKDKRIIMGDQCTNGMNANQSLNTFQGLTSDFNLDGILSEIEFRVRETPLSISELKFRLNDDYRKLIFPTWEERQKQKGGGKGGRSKEGELS